MTAPVLSLPWPTFFIPVASHKGGPGKTTIAVHIAHGMALRLMELTGRADIRVALVDLDPQGDATTWLGWDPPDNRFFDVVPEIESLNTFLPVPDRHRLTVADLVEMKIAGTYSRDALDWSVERVRHLEGLFLVGSDYKTTHINDRLNGLYGHPDYEGPVQTTTYPRELFEELRGMFDVVVFDCPPATSRFMDAAFQVGDRLVVPILPDQKSINAGVQTVISAQHGRAANAALDIGAIVVNGVHSDAHRIVRWSHPRAERVFGRYLFSKPIYYRTALTALDIYKPDLGRGETLFEADPLHSICAVFLELVDRLLSQHPSLLARLQHEPPRPPIGKDLETAVRAARGQEVAA